MVSRDGSPRIWRLKSRELLLDHPIVMGILNVTPDSFSDGGNFFSPDSALAHAMRMIDEGADIIDIGGESTRPGAIPVEAAQESDRVVPVMEELRRHVPDFVISIDTTKADVARAAIDAGASIINDVSAMRLDPDMPVVAATSSAGVVLMHSRGDVTNMASYQNAVYENVVSEVLDELGSQLLLAEEAGVDRKNIALDPGIGFSKRTEHSRELIEKLDQFCTYDCPVMVGLSRKRMLTDVVSRGPLTLEERDAATAAFNVLALQRGAIVFRVHNVKKNRQALDEAWSELT
ncbi:MAG TPA: dihydropteroate synthase [Gemmatimonadaceae bacterium]|nr:dihydropteroate synthase [Gemmatimonadaceae bacterium]